MKFLFPKKHYLKDDKFDCITIMNPGQTIDKSGIYCCLYHQKNKIKLLSGRTLPRCDFSGLNCDGYWHLLKEIPDKTWDEKHEDRLTKKIQLNKHRAFKTEFHRNLKKPKNNKWDLDKW